MQSTLESALAQANLGFSEQIQQAAAQAIESLLHGGNLGMLGAPANLVGLERDTGGARTGHRPHAARAPSAALERVDEFAGFAAENLALSKHVL